MEKLGCEECVAFVLKGKASWNDRKIGLWRFLVTKVIRS